MSFLAQFNFLKKRI